LRENMETMPVDIGMDIGDGRPIHKTGWGVRMASVRVPRRAEPVGVTRDPCGVARVAPDMDAALFRSRPQGVRDASGDREKILAPDIYAVTPAPRTCRALWQGMAG